MPFHILLVEEDDDDLRVEILDHLLRRKHRVTACSTIEEAIEVLADADDAAIAPDAIVSDICAALDASHNRAVLEAA